MPFGLLIGTERATAFQNAIQEELMKRRYSQDADPVMSEYITIMIINNKSPEQISSELEDLIGPDFERSFTDWLFAEAAKGEQPESAPAPPAVAEAPRTTTAPRDPPPHTDANRRNPPSGPRNGVPLYQQALSQATSNSSPTAQKRTSSARSPSPSGQGPSKARRVEAPSGPRAMREPRHGGPPAPGPRSLLDRVGPARPPHPNGFPHDEQMMMGMPGPFPPGMNEMDMNAMAAAAAMQQQQQMGGANPLMLQEMMMNQMALMAQMASSLGMLNPGMMGGFPMQGGMPPDMPMFNGAGPGPMDGFQQGHQGPNNGGRGRGGHQGRGRGGGRPHQPRPQTDEQQPPAPVPTEAAGATAAPAPQVAAPAPQPPASAPASVSAAFAIPERPQSPTLCKFGLKCTNAHCRWSHPSPVATAESGVVLSNDPCEAGKNCKDKDCVKAHVSPAAANPAIAVEHAKPHPPPSPVTHATSGVPCRYGMGCTRRDCTFQHPPGHPLSKAANSASQPCRYGSACTRANCPFQHPEGRVLPTSFHRGVAVNAPLVNVQNPQTGSMSGAVASPHKSAVFNNASSKADIERKIKALQEEKNRAEQKVKAAEAAAADKKAAAGGGGGEKTVTAAA